MDDFNTALLREKIIFVDEATGREAGADGHSHGDGHGHHPADADPDTHPDADADCGPPL